MRVRLPLRLLGVVAALVVAWGAIHIATSRSLTPVPVAWPSPAATASPAPLALPVAPATPASSSGGAIPFLPGALQQLDGSTRDTAVGLYALIQQLETAVGHRLQQLAQQLEPGR